MPAHPPMPSGAGRPEPGRRRALRHLGQLAAMTAGAGLWPVTGRAADRADAAPVRAAATTFASGLSQPWGLAFLPDRRLLVTQKRGALVIIASDGRRIEAPVAGVPRVHAAGQGGLLDVALDPDFATEPWVYLSYSEPGHGAEAGLSGTAVCRGRLVGTALQDVTVIFRQWPKTSGNGHYGSRLAFRADGTLWVSLGERQLGAPAQDLSTHLGKIVRIHRDGRVPADNPALSAGARPEIWSYGHRNAQGIAVHPDTGELWLHEHGPMGGDEVNIARAGANFGWPVRSYGCPYGSGGGQACQIGGGRHAPAYIEPLAWWGPSSIAPSGAAFYTGTMFAPWQGNLFMGALAGRALWRLTLKGDTVVGREALAAAAGERIRDVRQGPDGALYLLVEGQDGRVVRIAP